MNYKNNMLKFQPKRRSFAEYTFVTGTQNILPLYSYSSLSIFCYGAATYMISRHSQFFN